MILVKTKQNKLSSCFQEGFLTWIISLILAALAEAPDGAIHCDAEPQQW